MAKQKYTPPPGFTGQNIDRGFTQQELSTPAPKPTPPAPATQSSQFPVSEDHKIVDTTNAWYNRD